MNFSSNHIKRAVAFSLIEILVTVALLSVIILGLVAMFNQTRRAFISSLTQVDVLEAGRAAADLIAREVEQLTPSGVPYGTNFYVDTPGTYVQLIQPLVDPNDVRTNSMQEFYFLTTTYTPSHNLQWNLIGYKVSTPNHSLGSLYRFAYNNISTASLPYVLSSNFPPFNTFINTDPTSPTATNFSRIIDGVVDFRVRAYDPNGNLFGGLNTYNQNNVALVRQYVPPFLSDYNYVFGGGSLPAYVEIELGVVEDRMLGHYQAITNGGSANALAAGANYLANHAGQVHIFRQRIPIRNVNPAAYQ